MAKDLTHREEASMTEKKSVTRRSLIAAIGTAGVAAPLGSVLQRNAKAQTAARAPAKAFALLGDESHNPDMQRTAFQSTLVQDAGLPIDFSDEEKLLSYEMLQRYKILIIFRNGTRHPGGYSHLTGNRVSVPPLQKTLNGAFVATITDEQCQAIKRWVQEGGSLWAWHNNSRLSLMRKDYRDVQGATIIGHPPSRPYKVKIINHDHPITKDVNDFVITDEQHFLVYEKDPKYVLAMSVNEDGLTYRDRDGKQSNTCESVWAYDYGKGRVCMTAPGHDLFALWNPEFEKMQKNAVKWLLRET
jgi:type 1 glutamine amidotransferase